MNQNKIRVLKLKGTPYEMGAHHGQLYREEIRRYAAERVALVQAGQWSGQVQLKPRRSFKSGEGLPACP